MELTPMPFPTTFSSAFFTLLFLLLRSITGDNSAVEYDPRHAIALNCGFLRNSTAIDGRQWVGETDSASFVSFHGPASKSVDRSYSRDSTPYMTARASLSSFTYTFHVGSGYKFIRLHFYPASYSGFKRSTAFFTVKSGPYTLLNNFTAFDSLSLKSIVKEFTLYVPDDGQPLSITFSPLRAIIPSVETFAFVNGIEVVPMPPGLYYTMEDGDGYAGAYVAGHKARFHLGRDTAMEMVYRLNVGGIKLSSLHDPSMFREWTDDSNHILESSVFPITSINRIKYTKTSKDGAPQRLYRSTWSMNRNLQDGEGVSFTWKLPVDSGFRYLIRLHFCELDYDAKESGQKGFVILINNQMVETRVDLIKWGGEIGVAIHKDYLTTLRGDSTMGKRDLFVAMYPRHDVQSSEFIDSVLRGIEVFKLSDPNDNLAGGNLVLSHSYDSKKPRFRMPTMSINDIIIFSAILVVIIVQKLLEWIERSRSKSSYLIDVDNLSTKDRVEPDTSTVSPISLYESTKTKRDEHSCDDLCRKFSFDEISFATDNFDKRLEIGHRVFSKVYKGVINDIDGRVKMKVAIKRLNFAFIGRPNIHISEFERLFKLKHKHLVSLVGYCNENPDKIILVYEYMERGTLSDHIYKKKLNSNEDVTPLTWKKRLNICLDAAQGLNYLHEQQEVIHKNVTSNNILVDLNWVAKIKISDFGIGNKERVILTKKSDVYGFGIVLLHTLCGRPILHDRIGNECLTEYGMVDQIIDSSLRGQISRDSLESYIELVNLCLHENDDEQPTMAEIIEHLRSLLFDKLDFSRVSNFQNLSDIHIPGNLYDIFCRIERKRKIRKIRFIGSWNAAKQKIMNSKHL